MTTTAPPAPAHQRHAKRRPASALDRAIARGLAALERPEAPYFVLLAAFTAIGLYLRLDQLGGQSLWFDEADVVMQAQESLGALLRNFVTAGQNGPLFTLFLHFWIALFGVSEAAVRLPSALAGAVAIPLVYALGRALHGPKLGLYAAGILTVAPYQHWYAQDAKMYALVVALALVSTLLLVLADGADRRGLWLGYAVVTTLALYVHVTVALLLAAQLVWFALGQWRGVRAHPGRRGGIAFAALTLPYLPVALWELRFVRGNAVTWHRPIGLRAFLDDTLTKFATGVRADPGTQLRGLVLFLALALLGLLPLAWRHAPWAAPALSPRRRALLLGALFLLPLALFYAITLVRPLYADRYLIVVTPAFILLMAGGLLALERFFRPLSLIAIALILATSWVPLRDVNLATTAQKEDWRMAYEYIAAHAHPNDAIVVHPGYLDTTLDYYRLRDGANSPLRALPLLTIPADLTDGEQGDRSKDLLDQYLQKATAGYERVWLVLSPDRLSPQDPHDLLREWYTYNGRLIEERELNGVWLGLYTSRLYGLPYYPPVPIRLDQPIGDDGVTLVGYGYDLPPGASSVQAGTHLPLVLRWQFASSDVGQFAIRWRLLDQHGASVPNIGGSEPLLGNYPLRSWDKPIETWDYHDLVLPASLPPGDYRLVIEVTPATHTDQALAPGALTLGWFTVR